jgi:DNA-binding PadR family transcriptional regulator
METVNLKPRSNTSLEGLDHTLHLYTSKVDRYEIQRAFLVFMRKDERAVYVTRNDPASLIKEFKSMNVELGIIKPEELRNLENKGNCKLRIIVDAGSMLDQEGQEIKEREHYINELGRKQPLRCLCTYDVIRLDPDTIRQFAAYHNHLQLTTNDMTMLSGNFIDKSRLSYDSVEKMVKDNLETIILALLQRKTMCGTEIIGTIHMEFNVLLSPGTIYPLLQSLKDRGLLTSDKDGKAKRYAHAKDAESKIKNIIEERIQARKLLANYLMAEQIVKETD